MAIAKLIPVLELAPPDFSERPMPRDRSRHAQHWRDCIADAGFSPVEPLTGSWNVPVRNLRDPRLLTKLLEIHDDHIDPAEAEFTGSLAGGCALQLSEGPLIDAGCCNDLGGLQEWRDLIREAPRDWQHVWIGHPSVYARVRDGRIEVAGEAKLGQCGDPLGHAVLAEVAPSEEVALEEIRDFAGRLRAVFVELYGEAAARRVFESVISLGELEGLWDEA